MYSFNYRLSRPMFNFSKDIMNIIDQANRDVEFTPDAWWLDKYEFNRFFVYDEMQRNFFRYPLIQECSYFSCRAFTEQSFTLWKKKLGEATYAIALPDKAWPNIPLAHIGGQVHVVQNPSLVFSELDKLKCNGLHFERKRVSILVPFREQVSQRTAGYERVRRKYAWMYVGIPDYWEQQLDGGYFFEPCRLIRESKLKHVKDYYHFSKLEY